MRRMKQQFHCEKQKRLYLIPYSEGLTALGKGFSLPWVHNPHLDKFTWVALPKVIGSLAVLQNTVLFTGNEAKIDECLQN